MASLFLAWPAAAAPEIQANTFTQGAQKDPAIAKLQSGYVVVWASEGQDGSANGIYGQRYNTNGAKVGGELHISGDMVGDQTRPRVSGLADGGFIAVWNIKLPDGRTHFYGARFTAVGNKRGDDFWIATARRTFLPGPVDVAGLAGGGFVVVWKAEPAGQSDTDILARVYDLRGKPLGNEFVVNQADQPDTVFQSSPAVAALSDGGFVVVWVGDWDDLEIIGRRFNSAGSPVGRQFIANRQTYANQSQPSVSGLSDGGFVVAWESFDGDSATRRGIFAQRFAPAGAKVGPEIRVSTVPTNPQVSAFSDGGFIVVWQSAGQDGSGSGVYGQAFNATGGEAGDEFRLSITTLNDQRAPVVAADSAGKFVAAWSSPDQNDVGIFTRRFIVPLD